MPIITPAYPSTCVTHNVTASTQAIMKAEFKKGEKPYRFVHPLCLSFVSASEVAERVIIGTGEWSELFKKHEFFHKYRYYQRLSSSTTNADLRFKWCVLPSVKVRSVLEVILGRRSGQTLALLARGAGVQHQNDRPSGLGFGFSLTAFTTHHLLAATTSFDDGPKISATERARRCFIEVERGHRRSKPCEGGIEHHSGQGCFWFDQRPPPHNQSKFPLNRV
jgi:hypothetical protein